MARYAKKQMARHILSLFAERPATIQAIRWACVIKNGELIVVRRLNVMPEDPIIVESALESDESPSWCLIFYGIWKRWHKLAAANIEI
jgi:hypothetical protein